ncbi:MAG: hypothetical protein JST89_25885 [Cyanobacteria bacterium SZAS-4]|nr:hypothetical protein [Cyanobacteria bacterium SZAS-4]
MENFSYTRNPETLIADSEFLGDFLEHEVDMSALFGQDKDSINLLLRVAENTALPKAILEQLAHHPSAVIRTAVAENSSTPRAVLETLINDADADVRYALAENHNLSDEILNRLKNDSHPLVADRAEKTLTRLSTASVTEVLHVAFGTRLRAKDLLALLA